MHIDAILHQANVSHTSEASMHGCAAIALYVLGTFAIFGLMTLGLYRLDSGIPLLHLAYASLGISVLLLVLGCLRARSGAHRTPCGVGDTANPLYTPLHGSSLPHDPASRLRDLWFFGSATSIEEPSDSPDRLVARILFGCSHELTKAIRAYRRRIRMTQPQRAEAQRILDWLLSRGTGSKFHDLSGCDFDPEVLAILIRGELLRFRLENGAPCLIRNVIDHAEAEREG